jgi:hypothetical protein
MKWHVGIKSELFYLRSSNGRLNWTESGDHIAESNKIPEFSIHSHLSLRPVRAVEGELHNIQSSESRYA